MPHLIWLSPLHDNAVICVIVLMAGVTLTAAVKNGWSFLAYLCEGTGDWRLIRERWGPLLMCEAISSCGPRPLSGDVSLKDMGGKKERENRWHAALGKLAAIFSSKALITKLSLFT